MNSPSLVNMRICKLLDRPGGRKILALIATYRAKKCVGGDVDVKYSDGMWMHRVGRYVFPDGPSFKPLSGEYIYWNNQATYYFSDASDYWFQYYKPKTGDTIIDVGAGHGEDTLAFSQAVGPSGLVLAIEADPDSYIILRKFCLENRLYNTVIVHAAVMDERRTVKISRSDSWYSNSVIYAMPREVLSIYADTLDNICKSRGVTDIDFLKMNIEGAERYALFGISNLILNIKTLCVACHDFRANRGDGEEFRTRKIVENYLLTSGYELKYRNDDEREYVRDHVFGCQINEMCV